MKFQANIPFKLTKLFYEKLGEQPKDKSVLVIRDLFTAMHASIDNAVTFVTDDKEAFELFNKTVVSNDEFGNNDTAIFVDTEINKNAWKDFIKDLSTMPKFDVVIGNPPYEGKGRPLYLQILEVCHKVADKVIWLCPSQWVKNYKDSSYLKEVKEHCPLISHEHISNPFEDAAIANEVGIYEFGKSDNYENYDKIKLERFSNPLLAKSIWTKFENYSDFIEKHTREDKNLSKYVRAQWVRGHFLAGKPLWDWTTLFGEEQKVDFVKHKLEATTTSTPHFWNFETEEECKNFIASTETDICMFAHYICKTNQANNNQNIALIPWFGDYTKQWTEDMIAKELGLTQEEVDYIHEEMKPFGWKAQPKTRKTRKSKKNHLPK